MKKLRVLLIDNGVAAGGGRRLDTYADLKRDFDFVELVYEMNPSIMSYDLDVDTIFVHQSNRSEYDWAIRWAAKRSRPVFVFSKGVKSPRTKGNAVYMHQEVFREHVRGALKRLQASRQVSKDLFRPQRSSDQNVVLGETESSKETPPREVLPDEGLLRFTLRDPAPGQKVYPIVMTPENEIDGLATLAPFISMEKGYRFLIEEVYEGEVEGKAFELSGAPLALRIRLAAALGGAFWRFPIILRLGGEDPAEALWRWVQEDPRFGLFAQRELCYSLVGRDSALPVTKDLLDPDVLSRALLRIPTRPEDRTLDHHDLSNEWGVFRMWQGLSLLGAPVADKARLAALDKLMRSEFYWYRYALDALHERTTVLAELGQAGPKREDTVVDVWRRFLRQRIESQRPLRVLHIEDDDQEGWGHVVSTLFNSSAFGLAAGAAEVVKPQLDELTDDGELVGELGDVIHGNAWDLVICDMRLKGIDKMRTHSTDPEARGKYSGLGVIEAVKRDDKDRALGKETGPHVPIVVITASRDTRTRNAAHERGADGYWIKESPSHGADDEYTKRHVRDLMYMLRSVVSKREDIEFIWNLIRDARSVRTEPARQGLFRALGSSSEAVEQRFSKVEDLALRAYGFAVGTETQFRREVYGHEPYTLAFLQLWGCLNQTIRLRYKNRVGSNCYLLRADGTKELYWRGAEEWKGKAEWVQEALESSSIQNAKVYPYASNAGSGADMVYLSLLLIREGDVALERELNTLRQIRNDLDVIHGAEQTPKVRLAELRRLVEVLRSLLLLPEDPRQN